MSQCVRETIKKAVDESPGRLDAGGLVQRLIEIAMLNAAAGEKRQTMKRNCAFRCSCCS